MGFFKDLFSTKDDSAEAEAIIREYVDNHYIPLIEDWKITKEDFGEIEGKEIFKGEISYMAKQAAEVVRARKMKVPPHYAAIAREQLNQKIIDAARPYFTDFVRKYRTPNLMWPNNADIPLKDMEKFKAELNEHNVCLDLLSYDFSEEKMRWMLQQYGIRKKPAFQDNDTWNKNFSYSHEDLVNLTCILQDNGSCIQALDHALGDPRIMAKLELQQQQDRQFRKSFFEKYPDLLDLKPDKKEWAARYFKTFKGDLDYIEYVERIARGKGTIFEKDELENMVRQLLNKK